ncbi:HAD family hydrolase [Maridesulfovibrio sp.]|uniref:HAD family hydrolase n=1 Tax=Maridesulfovibrio sp. TaxID=2795000 RepID=UPI002A186C1D|nr:HAD family hydrolase [Maridesulfovibrio sp.]
MDFSAVIFDLDGTLLYTLEEIATVGNNALAGFGYATHPVSAYRNFVGSGARVLALRILPEEARTPENHERVFAAVLDEFERLLNTLTRPYSGIPEVLDLLQVAGKKLAVLSNKPDAFTKAAMAEFLPDTDFFEIRGGSPDFPLKPAPDGALAIAANMGIAPEHIVFVGDSDVDIKTAINAGMIPVGAGWGFRGPEELAAAGASVVFSNPGELEKLLYPI